MSQKLKLKFFGAANTVTGSKMMFEYDQKQYLFDCGLFQGPRELRERNWQALPQLKNCKAVILSHAHIDHSGYLPKFVKDGFNGPIYCTPATADLCRLLLMDAAFLQEEDARYANMSRYSHHNPALPLFDRQDAERALKLLHIVDFHQWQELSVGISFRFFRAGHILGSAITQISFQTPIGTRILTLSGDLGNGRSLILEDPEKILETDYLLLESTYGDRRQSREDVAVILEELINRVLKRRGTLVIPAFSVGRTQELLYLINQLEADGKIPAVPVYLDSPMANAATDIYIKYPEELRSDLVGDRSMARLVSSEFKEVKSSEQSMALCLSAEPKIVISAAGMLTGGRVMHHLKAKLPDEKSAVLFVGYQAAGTKGLLLKNGLKEIRIHHEKVNVNAEIVSADSLSAHADIEDLNRFVAGFTKKPVKIFLNHGEPNALESLRYSLTVDQGMNAEIAKEESEYILE